MNDEPIEAIIQVGKQQVRLGADTMEADIDHFFDAVITEVVLPLMESFSAQAPSKNLLGQEFWDEVFCRIAELVAEFPAAERQLILRALVSVETYRRFRQLLEDESPRA